MNTQCLLCGTEVFLQLSTVRQLELGEYINREYKNSDDLRDDVWSDISAADYIVTDVATLRCGGMDAKRNPCIKPTVTEEFYNALMKADLSDDAEESCTVAYLVHPIFKQIINSFIKQ